MTNNIISVPIAELIESPYQGRFFSDKVYLNQYAARRMKELADSIVTSGLLQPIIVRKMDGKYEIIDGHRRVKAFIHLGYGEIPALLVDRTEKEAQVMSVVSNIQRLGLSNLEKALAFEKILKAGIFKSKKDLSIKIGKDETYVGDIMNILKMDKRIIDDLATNNTTNDVRLLRHIRNAGELNEKGYSNLQYELYRQVIDNKISRKQVIELLIQDQTETGTDKPFQVSYRAKGYSVKIHKKLTKEQKGRLQAILERKVQEALEELKAG